ncbi:MAG: 1-acyl-sn-glycerol-3-phosphate acyltransferase [Desulfobacterales bacterium]|nr:1-acyl-sn-glycerol-3-phosphate acyltransferase [Desulfobacterales bacterium]
MKGLQANPYCKYLKPALDLIITLLLWFYYTLGFIIIFSPFYLSAYLFSKNREHAFQGLNHLFYKGFFFLVRILIPRAKWSIPEDILAIRSAVIVCNHISYLDSILMISLFKRHKTIVKSRFFTIPIFRQVIELSGYIPSSADGDLSDLLIQRIEEMDQFFASGGVLFAFPEGTRSRDGTIGPLNKGVFKIARRCKMPIQVLFIRNTGGLFQPGKFLFNTNFAEAITVELLASIDPEDQSSRLSVSDSIRRVRSLFEAQQAKSVF